MLASMGMLAFTHASSMIGTTSFCTSFTVTVQEMGLFTTSPLSVPSGASKVNSLVWPGSMPSSSSSKPAGM